MKILVHTGLQTTLNARVLTENLNIWQILRWPLRKWLHDRAVFGMLTTDYHLLRIDFVSRDSQSPENSCTSHMVVAQIPDDFAFFVTRYCIVNKQCFQCSHRCALDLTWFTVKPLMLAHPLFREFREPNKTANISCRPVFRIVWF